jgi:hypothetical protein
MAKKIKCIVKRPDEQFGHMTWVSDSLENLQEAVGGYIETVTLDNGVVLICNEEGKLRDMPYNFTLRRMRGVVTVQNAIFGTVIACGAEGDEFADIPIDFNEWKALLCEWGN